MQCVNCKYPESHIVKTETIANPPNTIRRRRECLRCGSRWSTHEKMRDPKEKRLEQLS